MKNPHLFSLPFSKFPFYFFLLAIFLTFSTCTSEKTKTVELVFAAGPDDGGTVQPLIDQFNVENEGAIHVTWKETSRSSNDFYDQVVADMESSSPEMDVICTDVIWTPALADKGWVVDLSQRFFSEHDPQEFIDASMNSVSFQFRIWGVPWFSDVGILYYRKDLLKKNGYEYPPATWDQLIEVARKNKQDSGIKYGYVFQGAEYEGGVTNACEFIWNSGGQILIGDLASAGSLGESTFDPSVIMVNSPQARTGLGELQKLVESGLLPPNIHEFREQDAAQSFQKGEALFMRSWASAYSFLLDPDTKVKPDQVGLTPLPTSDPNLVSYSCLGGWNLMVSAKSSDEKKEAAWKFISYMTSPESQKYRALKASVLPTLQEFYEDESFLAKVPVVKFARQVITVSRERPRSPEYMNMSPVIAKCFSQIVKGEIHPEEAVANLNANLETVLAQK